MLPTAVIRFFTDTAKVSYLALCTTGAPGQLLPITNHTEPSFERLLRSVTCRTGYVGKSALWKALHKAELFLLAIWQVPKWSSHSDGRCAGALNFRSWPGFADGALHRIAVFTLDFGRPMAALEKLSPMRTVGQELPVTTFTEPSFGRLLYFGTSLKFGQSDLPPHLP